MTIFNRITLGGLCMVPSFFTALPGRPVTRRSLITTRPARKNSWKRGERRQFTLQSLTADGEVKISVLGQNDKVVEYSPEANPVSEAAQADDGLRISVVRAQRLYNDHKWPNPLVVKLEGVKFVSMQ